nr:PREDICTED: matrix-remodeling-associated protein 5-like [Lepisosteus oculatus]XP_015207109.1 PREDICTED: matrix-remodeling-associated protein 5-like [Lepisosteus oculatus]XP_015207110.1 PREDICTED: matrix-remodeling-associated protein 5-like [Lepisosteus oculatus]
MSPLGTHPLHAGAALGLLLALPLVLRACPQPCSCPGPREVHCTFRHLASPPAGLPRDSERVNLGYNNIQGVGVLEFTALSRLELLMLHGNSIDSVSPGAFSDLHSLQILKLSYNKLKRLSPGMFQGLSGLVRLYLDHNTIAFVEPFSFSGLTALKLLQLEGNQLRDVHPHTFMTLSFLGSFWSSSLRHLYLADNSLESLLPGTLQHLDKLEVLYLHGNPWTCDCQMRWLLEWNKKREGVIKCKKERDSGGSELCSLCSTPQHLNSSQVFLLSPEELLCDRPALQSPMKLKESFSWEDPEPESPVVQDFDPALGQLTFMLSDNQENVAHVGCVVKHPGEGTSLVWENLSVPGQVAVNVTLITLLECEIEKDELQKLWRLIAYYYESPAILERGLEQKNTSRTAFQYSQVSNEDSPYFTELKGHLLAEPEWLLQPRVTLQLNRHKTTTKKLVLNYSTFISDHITSWGPHRTWVLIHRGHVDRVQTVLEGSKATLVCKAESSGEATFEWMLPDLSTANSSHTRLVASDKGKLIISPTVVSDSGLYHCLVRTEDEVDLVSFRLIVREQLLSPDSLNGQQVSVHSGHSLTLPCSVSSVPPSRVAWYLPTSHILLPSPPSGRVYMSTNGSLVITKASQEDAGEYSCLAGNLYGADMLSHLVLVKEKVDLVPPRLGGTGKESTGGISYKRYQATQVEEEEGSGGLEVEISGPDPIRVQDKTRLQHASSRGNSNRNSKAKKVWEGKRRNNLSVKELDPKRWAQILAKAHRKVPDTTTTTTPEGDDGSWLLATSVPSVNTEKTLESAKNKLELLQTTPTQPIQPTQDSPIHVYVEREKSSIPIRLLVLSESITKNPDKNPFAKPNPQEVAQPTKPKPRVQAVEKTTADETHGRTPLYRRRRPQHRIRPNGSSQNPSFPSFTRLNFRPGNTDYTPANQKGDYTTTSRYSNSTQSTDKNENSTDSNPSVHYNINKDYTMVTTTQPLPVTMKTMPSSVEYKKYLSAAEHSGSPYNMTPAFTRSPAMSTSTEQISSSTIILGHKFTSIQPNIQNTPWTSENRNLQRLMFETAERTVPQSTTSESVHSLTTMQWRATVPPSFILLQTIPTTHTDSLFSKPKINHILSQSPSSPLVSTVSTEATHLVKPSLSKWNAFFPITQSPLITPEKALMQTVGSNSRSPSGPYEKGDNRGLFFNQPANTHKDLSQTIRRKGNSFRGQTESLSKVKDKTPWLLQPHSQKRFQAPPTHWPSTTTFSGPVRNLAPGKPPVHGPWQYYPFPNRAWPFHYPWGRGFVVTNRPEITALTAKPTLSVSLTSSPLQNTSTNPAFKLQVTNSGTRSRDFLLLSKLRDRYRHPYLDPSFLSQLRRSATKPPKVTALTSRPHQAPTSSKSHSPITPASPSLLSPTNKPSSTASVLFGSRWHYNHGAPRKLSTALPFPNLMGSGVKPRIASVNLVSLSVLAEEDVFLPCESSGDPKPSVSWTKVSTGATIQANTRHGQRFEVLENGTFVIKNVQLQDRGQYLCTAQNAFGSDRVVVTLAVLTQPPRILPPKSAEVSVYVGRSANLDCMAAGKPQAQISWILPDRTFVRNVGLVDIRVTLLLNGTLRIQAANFSSKGDYKCIASNAAGADTVTYHLHVVALPPSIYEGASENVVLPIGRSVYVHCTARGEPQPSLKWTTPGGMQIKPSQFLGGRLFVFPNGTLYVKNVSPAEAGKYECSAANTVGTTSRVVQLVVKEAGSLRHAPSQQHKVAATYGSTVYLHCPESASTQPGALWRLPAKTLVDHRHSPLRHVSAFPNGTLRIQLLTEQDGGDYLCMYRRPNGDDLELFQLEVLMKPPKIKHRGTVHKKVGYGENFRVDCVASGLPDPEVTWSLPDGTVISNALQSDDSGARSRRYVIFGNGTLLLQQMEMRDEGDYTCYAENRLGKDEMKVRVRVVPESPRILSKEQVSLWGKPGEPVHMKCEATGEPSPAIIWLSPRNEIITASSGRYQILGDGTLVIRKVGMGDRGTYACVARNTAGDDIKNVKLEVEGEEPQINGRKGSTNLRVSAVSYQTKMLDCKADGMPEPLVSWTTSYGITLPTPYLGGRFQVHRNGSLELRGLRRSDSGQFVCLARSDLGEARLEVELDVAPTAERPSFPGPHTEAVILKPDGSDVTMECPAQGRPAPELTWALPNSTILAPGTRLSRFLHYPGNGTLRIVHPAPTDSGVYRCLARNMAGQSEKRYVLELGRKPQIRGISGVFKISFGQSMNLRCPVDGWPQPTISWTLPNGVVLDKPQVNGRMTYLINSTLHLRDTATFDRGTYVCKATNAFGSAALSIPVVVMVYPPHITSSPPSITRVNRGSPVKLSCVAAGIPKPDISWTLPGRTTLVPSSRFSLQGGIHMTAEGSLIIQNPMLMNSGIYKCNARNALGMDFKPTYLQVL